jgi:hypothetical protein
MKVGAFGNRQICNLGKDKMQHHGENVRHEPASSDYGTDHDIYIQTMMLRLCLNQLVGLLERKYT